LSVGAGPAELRHGPARDRGHRAVRPGQAPVGAEGRPHGRERVGAGIRARARARAGAREQLNGGGRGGGEDAKLGVTRSRSRGGPTMRQHATAPLALAIAVLTAACGASDGGAAARWAGTVDTLPSGHIVVKNPDAPLWRPGEEWRVVEELRIGRADGNGPDLFGRISSLAVDPGGRIWVLEGQAQELRVFGPDGQYIRTVGRKGGGPGEFAQAVQVELGPDGNIWVMDPSNNRHSVFDTAGTYLEGKRALGGFVILPWPGGFDREGRYYSPVPMRGEGFRWALVMHDAAYQPVDTLEPPRDPVEREDFRSPDGRISARVPFSGGLVWQPSPAGTIWALVTDQYRLFELTPDGDTLRTITRRFTPLP